MAPCFSLWFFLIVGIILGFIVNEGKNGVYLSANYGNGKNMFAFGKNSYGISDINLTSLNDSEGQLLSSKIKKLSVEESLGQSLRKLAQNGDGSFAPIPVLIKIHLINEKNINDPVARACKNSPLFQNFLIAYGAEDEEGNDILIKGILGLNVGLEHISDCVPQEQGDNETWASKEHVSN